MIEFYGHLTTLHSTTTLFLCRLDQTGPLRNTLCHTRHLVHLAIPLRHPRVLLPPARQLFELDIEDLVPHHERHIRVRDSATDEPLLVAVRELFLKDREDPAGLVEVAVYRTVDLLRVKSGFNREPAELLTFFSWYPRKCIAWP